MKYFDTLGVTIDCSRNAVMNIEALKDFLSILSRMGYNQVMLYTEDTYEADGEEYLGHLRGRYSKAELKEIDDYAFNLGVELVPCIQTLGHLGPIMKWPKYAEIRDTDDILLVDDEHTYDFIENIISSMRECFRSNKIHIGMDEAGNLGKGKYRDIHGEMPKFDIFLSHLERVCKITEKYSFKPMMWSDMFYRIACGGEYYTVNPTFDKSVVEKIPQNLTLVYWDYYHTDIDTYLGMIDGHFVLSDNLVFAAGARKWAGFTPDNEYSIRTIKPGFEACIKKGVKNAIVTTWGDNGGETPVYSMLPSFCYAACLACGITETEEIKLKFKEWVGFEFDDFLLLDLPDKLDDTARNANPSKYELYNDLFLGKLNLNVSLEDSKYYKELSEKLICTSDRMGRYSYLFETSAKLCSLLEIKSTIGIRTKKAYKENDIETLKNILPEYTEMITRMEDFYYAFRNQWYKENKPHGFDVSDIRLGGALMRMKSCKDRLEDYLNGAIKEIPELAEPDLPYGKAGHRYINSWSASVSANNL